MPVTKGQLAQLMDSYLRYQEEGKREKPKQSEKPNDSKQRQETEPRPR